MSIEKNTKASLSHETGGYTTVLNSTIQNIKNLQASGLYSYLATLPENWVICKLQLAQQFGCGRDKINSCFNYLKKLGLIEVTMLRNELGQCIGWDYRLRCKIPEHIVNATQNTEKPYSSKSSRILKNQNVGKPESGKSAPTNKEQEKNKDSLKKQNKGPVSSVFGNSSFVRGHIDSMLRNKGLSLTEDLINQIMYYIGMELDFDIVVKKINIALKMIRENRWQTPYGWNGGEATAAIQPAKKQETDEQRKERQFFENELEKEKTKTGYISKKLQEFPEMRAKYQ